MNQHSRADSRSPCKVIHCTSSKLMNIIIRSSPSAPVSATWLPQCQPAAPVLPQCIATLAYHICSPSTAGTGTGTEHRRLEWNRWMEWNEDKSVLAPTPEARWNCKCLSCRHRCPVLSLTLPSSTTRSVPSTSSPSHPHTPSQGYNGPLTRLLPGYISVPC